MIKTPLLCLRGDHEGGNIEEYTLGVKEAGILNMQSSIIPDCGHFDPEEQSEETWKQI